MERGSTGRVTREERLFFPGLNGQARPSAAGRSRPPGHSRPFCVCPAECLRSPAYTLLTTCARCKCLAFYKPAVSAPLQPFQREVAWSVCSASLSSRRKSGCSKRSFLQNYSILLVQPQELQCPNQRPLLLAHPPLLFSELFPSRWPMAECLETATKLNVPQCPSRNTILRGLC